MSFAAFEEYEKKYQQQYDDIQFPVIRPTIVVSIKLLRFRNVSDRKIFDFFSTPDPKFEISCPKVGTESVKSFKTRNIKDHVTTGEINEEFKFVIPHDFPSTEEFPINIKLINQGYVFDDLIGEQTIYAKDLETDGKAINKTMHFGKNNGELELEIKKTRETSPDFRCGFGLCSQEREFRKKRIPIVHKAMNKLLGSEGPTNLLETPIVSLVGSGGGYRAVVGMCGAMEALRDAGITEITTYHSGLSGGAWYLSAAYALRACTQPDLEKVHDEMRERMNEHLMWSLVSPFNIISYGKFAKGFFDLYSLPKTLVNYFPGFLVTKQLFGQDKLDVKLSDLAHYVDSGEAPYPIVTAIQVKNIIPARKFYVHTEISPHEISIPSHGVGLTPEDGGSVWSNGFLVRKTPEYPLHFTVGMTGCAFSILLNQYFKYGDEGGHFLSSELDEIRTEERKKEKHIRVALGNLVNNESEDESDEETDEETETETDSKSPLSTPNSDSLGSAAGFALAPGELNAIETAARSALTSSIAPTFPELSELPAIVKVMSRITYNVIRKTKLFTNREWLIGRTAKLRNFFLNYQPEKRFLLNPLLENEVQMLDKHQLQIIKKAGHKHMNKKKTIPSTYQNLSFIDAGVLKNVPTEAVLRPQRGTDVMIVLDFSDTESDDNFSYQALLEAAAHAWQSGLKFPKIHLEEIQKLPPKEFLIFPSDADDCPTVVWFTLSNKQFKDLHNYSPRSKIKSPKGEHRVFNDFNVFGENSEYGTFRFKYDAYRFDQLRELMYHNVSSHIEEIKRAVADAVERRRSRQRSFQSNV